MITINLIPLLLLAFSVPVQMRELGGLEKLMENVVDIVSPQDLQSEQDSNDTPDQGFKVNCFAFDNMSVKTSQEYFEISLDPGNSNKTSCSVKVTYENPVNMKPKSLLYITMAERMILKMESCDSHSFQITQKGYIQVYCGGEILMTEMPAEDNKLHISYRTSLNLTSEHPLLRFKMTLHDRSLIWSNEKNVIFDKLLHSNFHPGAKMLTYDESLSTYQVCPGICGKKSSRDTDYYKGYPIAAHFTQFPWYTRVMVEFNSKNTSFVLRCGGSIINGYTILTAASCVTPLPNMTSEVKVNVIVGDNSDHRFGNNIEQHLSVKKIVVHPDFVYVAPTRKNSTKNNIAILKLSEKIKFGVFATPICLPATRDHGGAVGIVLGYETNPNGTETMQRGAVWATPAEDEPEVGKSDLYTGKYVKFDEKYTTCGDLGSPIIMYMRNKAYQIGIKSTGYDCEEFLTDKSEGFLKHTNVTQHWEFISKHSNASSVTKCYNI